MMSPSGPVGTLNQEIGKDGLYKGAREHQNSRATDVVGLSPTLKKYSGKDVVWSRQSQGRHWWRAHVHTVTNFVVS
jgi:hypothetical protein